MLDKDNLIQATVAVCDVERRRQYGAQTFYWIAGLSVVNAILMITGSNVSFLAGLGVTMWVTGIAMSIGENAHAGAVATISIAVTAMVALFFGGFGFLARKGMGWAFIVGMILYVLDALLLLPLGDWFGIAFHAWMLRSIWSGYQAHLQLAAFMSAPQPTDGAGFTPASQAAETPGNA